MFKESSLKFLEELMNTSSPSGHEEAAAACYRNYLGEFADRVYTDVMGNTIGILNEGADFKVMLAGHYDEIGFQITHISDEGFLYFHNVGGIDKLTVPGTELNIITDNGLVPGIIGKKPIHLLKPEERNKALELSDSWIDIGAESKEDALKKVSIGDAVAVRTNFEFLGENRVKSKGMDDKIGAFIVAETFANLSKKGIDIGVYCVGTVQEELGLRGATTSAFGISPNVGFAVDVGFTSDVPNVDKKTVGDISLGKGPILVKNADNNSVLGKRMREIATAKKIDFQLSAGHRASGGTDTATIQLTQSGVATALISIPNRYMHSPVEMCDMRDVKGAIEILTETILALKPSDTFIPGVD